MSPMRFIASSALACVAVAANALPVRFDFRRPESARAWQAQHDVASLIAVPDGMAIKISGDDPYIAGPPRDYPSGQPLWLHLRLKSPSNGMGQVFWFSTTKGPNEGDSVRFPVSAGGWADVRVPIPPLGKATRLRFDPPGDHGTVTLALIEAAARPTWKEPVWPKPPTAFTTDSPRLRTGTLSVVPSDTTYGGVKVSVGGKLMAIGNARPLIGYVIGGRTRWLDINRLGETRVADLGRYNTYVVTLSDPDDGEWKLQQSYRKLGHCVEVETTVSCTRDRDILYLPMLTLLPGAGSFGTHKTQALFSGLEYLGQDEPSSSEKDIIGPGANRRVPDTAKITQPLMVVQHDGRYVGLIWKPSPDFCAVFDSPDRTFRSGGHLMGILYPGSNGSDREEGRLLPYAPRRLAAGHKIVLEAKIIGGIGDSVVPAVQQYAGLNPPVTPPATGLDWSKYASLASAGWLDSGISNDGLYAHAYPGSFKPQPAADAAVWMDYLAGQTADTTLAGRLKHASSDALAHVPASELNNAGVGHVRYPVPALVYGDALQSVRKAVRDAKEVVGSFTPVGGVVYRPKPEGPDLGRTHFSREANGLTADRVLQVLKAAEYSSDAGLRKDGLRLLDALGKYDNTVPRGAQTWEVPLHTPDILASANLVKAYVIGYELTGEKRYLESAKYWAWTGVPFVYLVRPVEKPVGLYGTIAVFGATQWVAPNWMGLPVQWCGLVYADAIADLARYDASGPWTRLVAGIAASGVQQTHSLKIDAKRQGLLPDSFNLHGQIRNDVAINPATLLPSALRLYGREPIYDRHAFANGMIVHVPGLIPDARQTTDGIAFTVYGWPRGQYQILIVGLKVHPRKVLVNGGDPDATFDSGLGALVIRTTGTAIVEITGH